MAGITKGCSALSCALLVVTVLVVSLQFVRSSTLILGAMMNIVGQGDTLSMLTNPVSDDITVYIEMIEEMDKYYGNSYTKIERITQEACPLPNNS